MDVAVVPGRPLSAARTLRAGVPHPPPSVCRGSVYSGEMLPALIAHLPADREPLGLREVQMAGRLALTLREYRALEAGDLWLSYDLCERICELCGWP